MPHTSDTPDNNLPQTKKKKALREENRVEGKKKKRKANKFIMIHCALVRSSIALHTYEVSVKLSTSAVAARPPASERIMDGMAYGDKRSGLADE